MATMSSETAKHSIDSLAHNWLDTVPDWSCQIDSYDAIALPLTAEVEYTLSTTREVTRVSGRSETTCENAAKADELLSSLEYAVSDPVSSDILDQAAAFIQESPLAAMDGENELLSITHSWLSKCSPCAGTGQVTCSECNGSGKSQCVRCNGGGRMVCPGCAGGFVQGFDAVTGRPEAKACPRCHGLNQVSCEICGGTGRRICGKCGGRKTLQCQPCQGTGEFTNYSTVNVHLHPRTAYRWPVDSAPSWFQQYINESTRDGRRPALEEVVDWDTKGVEIKNVNEYPLASSIEGTIHCATVQVRPDCDFSSDTHSCFLVGRGHQPYWLDGLFDSTLSTLTARAQDASVDDVGTVRQWTSCALVKAIHELKSPDQELPGPIEDAGAVRGETKAEAWDLLFRIRTSIKKRRTLLPVTDIMNRVFVYAISLLLLCWAADAFIRGHVPWDRLGIGAAIRVAPPLLSRIADAPVEETAETLFSMVLAGGIGTLIGYLLLANLQRPSIPAIVISWVVLSPLLYLFWLGNAVVLHASAEYGNLHSTGAGTIAGEALASALGVVWVIPEVLIIAALIAIARTRRVVDRTNKNLAERLESPALMRLLGYKAS